MRLSKALAQRGKHMIEKQSASQPFSPDLDRAKDNARAVLLNRRKRKNKLVSTDVTGWTK